MPTTPWTQVVPEPLPTEPDPHGERKLAEARERAAEVAAADRAVADAQTRVSEALAAHYPITAEGLATIAGRYAVEARAWSRLAYAMNWVEVPSSAYRAVWSAQIIATDRAKGWRARANAAKAEGR